MGVEYNKTSQQINQFIYIVVHFINFYYMLFYTGLWDQGSENFSTESQIVKSLGFAAQEAKISALYRYLNNHLKM